MHEELAKAHFNRDTAALTDDMASRIGLTLHSRAFPLLDVTVRHVMPVRLRFQCDDWNDIPPLIKILMRDGSPWRGPLPPGNVFNANGGNGNEPFICIPGSRDYHSRHSDMPWADYRGKDGMDLFGILMQLKSYWVRNVQR